MVDLEVVMKGLRYLVCGVALVASVGVSSASAANWDPQNTVVHASQVGTGTLVTDPSGGTVRCTNGTTDLRAASATPATATTITTTNPVVFSGCTALGFPATVTTFGDWHFTATSTTSVNVTATPSTAGGLVATIHVPAVGCTINAGHTTILNNDWNNTTKNLTITPTGFAITTNSEACTTFFGTTGTLETTFNAPTANIT